MHLYNRYFALSIYWRHWRHLYLRRGPHHRFLRVGPVCLVWQHTNYPDP